MSGGIEPHSERRSVAISVRTRVRRGAQTDDRFEETDDS